MSDNKLDIWNSVRLGSQVLWRDANGKDRDATVTKFVSTTSYIGVTDNSGKFKGREVSIHVESIVAIFDVMGVVPPYDVAAGVAVAGVGIIQCDATGAEIKACTDSLGSHVIVRGMNAHLLSPKLPNHSAARALGMAVAREGLDVCAWQPPINTFGDLMMAVIQEQFACQQSR